MLSSCEEGARDFLVKGTGVGAGVGGCWNRCSIDLTRLEADVGSWLGAVTALLDVMTWLAENTFVVHDGLFDEVPFEVVDGNCDGANIVLEFTLAIAAAGTMRTSTIFSLGLSRVWTDCDSIINVSNLSLTASDFILRM